MNIDALLNDETVVKPTHENLAAGAIDIAIRDAEIHGTKLVVQLDGKIEELTPDEMRARLAQS